MRVSLPAPKPCSECGSDPILHTPEYAANLAGALVRPLLTFSLALGERVLPAPQLRPTAGFDIQKMLNRVGMGEYLDAPDQKTLLLDHVLWQEAAARGIRMREFRPLGLPVHSFVAEIPGRGRLAFDSIPFVGGQRPVWWIDDKAEVKKRFLALGIPVPKGGATWTQGGAKKIFAKVGGSVVVKPHEGSATRHTTLHVQDEEDLVRAFKAARQVSPKVIVEQELAGAVYRPTLIKGKLAATLRRDPPTVVGDGTSTIEQLVTKENEHPARSGPYYSKIVLNEAVDMELDRQGLNSASVLPKGACATLNQKINWSVGGTTTDVSDVVHADNVALFERIADVLNAPIVGIDFITPDITKSWREVPCGVIECNGRPFFDNHHLPFKGEPRNVAGMIWDLVEQEKTS